MSEERANSGVPEPIHPVTLPALTTDAGLLTGYRTRAEELLGWVRDLTIRDAETLGEATVRVGEITSATKTAERQRKQWLEPGSDWAQRVNAMVKWVVGPLAEADTLLRQKIVRYQQDERTRAETERRRIAEEARRVEEEARQARQEAERLQREARAAAAKLAEATTLPEFFERQAEVEETQAHAQAGVIAAAETLRQAQQAAEAVAAVPQPSKTLVVGGTTATTVQRWTYRVDNLDLVPRAFLMVDPKKAQKAVDGGVRTIPGLTIYQAEHLAVGRAKP